MQKPDVIFGGQDKLLLSLIASWRGPLFREPRHLGALGGAFFPFSEMRSSLALIRCPRASSEKKVCALTCKSPDERMVEVSGSTTSYVSLLDGQRNRFRRS